MRKTVTFTVGWGWPSSRWFKVNKHSVPNHFTSLTVFFGKFRLHFRYITNTWEKK